MISTGAMNRYAFRLDFRKSLIIKASAMEGFELSVLRRPLLPNKSPSELDGSQR